MLMLEEEGYLSEREELCWVESAGGPLVVVELGGIACWTGSEGGDYNEACGVSDYVGTLSREWGTILVLGDEPFPTAWTQLEGHGHCFLRWVAANDEESLLRLVNSTDFTKERAEETVLFESEPFGARMFDAALTGSENGEFVAVNLPKVRQVVTYRVSDEDNEALVSLFSL